MIRLGVNVDHIATIRNARDESYPSPAQAAQLAELGGANNITCHLREDRRHIRDKDVGLIIGSINIPLNFEMAVTDEMVKIAISHRPAAVSLVPEKREERTTEGGMDLEINSGAIRNATVALKESGSLVAFFVEANERTMDLSAELGADAVELHTGSLCKQLDRTHKTTEKHALLAPFIAAAKKAHANGLQVHVGHGLHYGNAGWIQLIPHCEEANIGHSIVGRATMIGLAEATKEMYRLINDPNNCPIAQMKS